MYNQILEEILNNNQQLKKMYLKDKTNFIYFLFLFYTVNKDKRVENINITTFKRRVENKYLINNIYKIAYYNLGFSNMFENAIKESYSYLLTFDISSIKNLLINLILDSLFLNTMVDTSYEILERSFFPLNLGNYLILTNYPKKYLYNDEIELNSITFNYYNNSLNNLSLMYFEIRGIRSKLFDLQYILKENDESYDNIYFCLPYLNQANLEDIETLYKKRIGSIELESVKDLHSHLKKDGHLVMILPTGILNNIKDFRNKKYFVDNGYINTIVELPKLQVIPFKISAIFFSYDNKSVSITNATKYALNLKKDTLINSEKILRAVTGQVEGTLVEMDINYIKENKYDLTPHRYTDRLHYDFINPTKLKDLTIEMFRGYQISADMLEEYLSEFPTRIKLLTLSDIIDGEIDTANIQSLKAVDKKMEHYILKNNDLVISCKGKSFKTAVVNVPRFETYISTGSIIVIRLNTELIDPYYLKIFLDSKVGNDALKNIQTGSSVLSLNPTKLLNIDIPLIEMIKQQQISSSYKYKLQNIKEVKEVMDDMKKDMEKKFDKDFLTLLQ